MLNAAFTAGFQPKQSSPSISSKTIRAFAAGFRPGRSSRRLGTVKAQRGLENGTGRKYLFDGRRFGQRRHCDALLRRFAAPKAEAFVADGRVIGGAMRRTEIGGADPETAPAKEPVGAVSEA